MKTMYKSSSEEDTQQIGMELASNAKAGDIFALYGSLGAGKTALVKGMAKELNVAEGVTSPTFTIINEYNGDKPLYHMDLYRIENGEELFQTGFEEYLHEEGIVVIEWPQVALSLLKNIPHWEIKIEILSEYNRTITVTAKDGVK